jgi:glutamine synthetase
MQLDSTELNEQIKKYIEQHDIRHIKIGISDFNGVMRGKYISLNKFYSALEKGMGFCDVIIGSDINDELIADLKFTGWHSGYPDAPIRIIPESARKIPFEDKTLFFLCEFTEEAQHIGPRQLLKRVVERAQQMGFQATAGMEFEFSVFEESMHSLQEKRFHDLRPMSPGNCGYSTLRNTTYADFYTDLLDLCQLMNFPLEGFHTEIGPGVLEAALQADHAVAAADKAALFKTFSKSYAHQAGYCLCFMAKWKREQQGQSGHTHLSLQDLNGKPLFFDANAPQNISDTMRHFIAGQQKLMPEFLAMVTPNVNSFARLVPGYWAPTYASWGIDNRTCALRAILGSAKSQRVEYRIPGADANPYLTLAAALASGLYGIEHKLEPSEPVTGNAYQQTPGDVAQCLPTDLASAAARLRQSQAAREFFGDLFVDDYATTREWEAREAQRHVTDWQLERYFELA